MPLRAQLNSKNIFAYNYNSEQWEELRKQRSEIHMHCCGAGAVLKTSKLGTRFFSHKRKGDCASLPESPEHLYLKSLIAKIGISLGWHVETEHSGSTPSGEKWIADTYCTKGNAKLAIEVQWSKQKKEEFIRRQERYAESGVRGLWLYRLSGNKHYIFTDLPYHKAIPVFGIRLTNGDLKTLRVVAFNEPIESFIEGMFAGKLKWRTRLIKEKKYRAHVIPHQVICGYCGKKINTIIAIKIRDEEGNDVDFKFFDEDGVSKLIMKYADPKVLAANLIGTIKSRVTNKRGSRWITNGCVYCDAVTGKNYNHCDTMAEYCGEDPDSVHSFEMPYDSVPLKIHDWYFGQKRFSIHGWYK